ncbi:MAG: hypothetical protein J6C67_02165 [Muribaculaceae bacterium]|nr:hypothetical protein [Muribaculaceae bacterium]
MEVWHNYYGYVDALAGVWCGDTINREFALFAADYYGSGSGREDIKAAQTYFAIGLADIQAFDFASASANTVTARSFAEKTDDYLWRGRILLCDSRFYNFYSRQ